ncbi:acyl-CoA dehydrogenase family protein, partial [Streptomyces toxytricini]
PAELWADAAKLGYLGVNLPEEYGGGRAGRPAAWCGVRAVGARWAAVVRPAAGRLPARRHAANPPTRPGSHAPRSPWDRRRRLAGRRGPGGGRAAVPAVLQPCALGNRP